MNPWTGASWEHRVTPVVTSNEVTTLAVGHSTMSALLSFIFVSEQDILADLIFGRCSTRVSPRTLAVLRVFHGFPPSFQTDTGVVL
jgi:hypothetical protein